MALRNTKNGKATGPDNLPIEVWKSLGRTGVNCLIFLKEALNKITDEEKFPDKWRKSIFITIFKNNNNNNNVFNSYRSTPRYIQCNLIYEKKRKLRAKTNSTW